MNQEIERKFLVSHAGWRKHAQGVRYRQAYLNRTPERTVRVRTAADKGFLTIKGISRGASRAEFEYEIPYVDAAAMLETLCEQPVLEKNRYTTEYAGFTWEIDEFLAENQGLVVAEIELEREDQFFEKPDWAGREVTGDPKYFNSNLCAYPYALWPEKVNRENK